MSIDYSTWTPDTIACIIENDSLMNGSITDENEQRLHIRLRELGFVTTMVSGEEDIPEFWYHPDHWTEIHSGAGDYWLEFASVAALTDEAKRWLDGGDQ